ncbi:MAG: NapC/NirT family cytochrome c [Thermodesulfobacteriota bacterium]
MNKYFELIMDFLKILVRSRVSMAGAVVSGLIFPVLVVLLFIDMQGIVQNPYFGFLIYMVMGPLFVIGLLTVLVGQFLFRDREEIGLFTLEYIREQFNMPGRFIRVRKLIYISSTLGFFTLIVIVVVSYTGFRYTETIGFCGQFCHDVMEPQYISHQNSPHSRIACVKCHISGSSDLVTRSKVSGVTMIFSTVLGRYERPIKNPVHSLRPDREVCEQCHRPEVFHGDKLYIKDYFLADEQNTRVQTVLLMRIGSSGYRDRLAQGIHWHVSPDHKTYYRSARDDQDRITEVKLVDHDGSVFIFKNKEEPLDRELGEEDYRLMDCMDCHNRPTHVFLPASEAVDRKIAMGAIARTLPFIKKVALEVILQKYDSKAQARRRIAEGIEGWYAENRPDVPVERKTELDQAVNVIYQAWAENVFPEMGIGWETYRNNLAHESGNGCFRCHSDSYQTTEGRGIPNNCDLCHYILAEKQPSPDIMRILHGEKI